MSPHVCGLAAALPPEGAHLPQAACRTYGVDSENRPQRGQFLPDLQAHSPAMGQKDGVLEERRSQKWTAAVDSQPTFHKSDRLQGAARRGKHYAAR